MEKLNGAFRVYPHDKSRAAELGLLFPDSFVPAVEQAGSSGAQAMRLLIYGIRYDDAGDA